MGLSEEEIIHIITLGQTKAPEIYGVGDDAARTREGVIISQDTMVERIHFDDKLSPKDVGWKIVAVNVSDMAAMGCYPNWCTLSASLPQKTSKEWIRDFSTGLRLALKHWNIKLIGGDTTRSNNDIVLSMTMGSIPSSKTIWQSGAQNGEDIWVTGVLGDAAHGFFNKDAKYSIEWLRRPEPPVAFANALAKCQLVSSMTDISDGLKVNLTRICQASSLGAVVDPASLPKSSELYNHKDALAYQTVFGEDYQLLFTAPPSRNQIIRQTAAQNKVLLTKIGTMISDPERIELKGTSWPKPLYSQF
jgi:thiamine-monophosphate kinase